MEDIKTTAANVSRIEKMRVCPRFDKCSAPICPLDPEWKKCTMFDEDAVCFLQLEAAKPNAKSVFFDAGVGHLFELVLVPIETMSERWGRVRRQTERAKTTGSRMSRIPPWLRKPGD